MSIGAFGENFPYTNLHDLNLDWIIQVMKDFYSKYPDVMEELAKRILKPTTDPNGNNGDMLISNGDGTTRWEDMDIEVYSRIKEAVDEWLDEHPEATTTVEDHSLENIKFVLGTLNYITPEMFGAKGDGTTDDSDAFDLMFQNNCNNILLSNNYFLDDNILIPNNKTVFGKGHIISDHSVSLGNNVLIRELKFSPFTPITRVDGRPTDSNGIRIRAYQTNNIVIDSINIEDGAFTADGAGNIYIANSRITGMDVVGGCIESFNNSHDIHISKCVLTGSLTNGCYFHTSNNIIVSECEMFNNGHSGVHVPYSSFITVEKCKIHDHPYYDGIDFNFSADDDVATTQVNSKLLNNVCFNNAQTGIYVSGSNVIIDGNTCYNNGTEGIKIYPYLQQGRCQNITITNNNVYDNTTTGTRTMEVLVEISDNIIALHNNITKASGQTYYFTSTNGILSDFATNGTIQVTSNCTDVKQTATISRTDDILPIKLRGDSVYWQNANANEITESGAYILNVGSGNATNFPGTSAMGLLLVIKWNNNFIMQFFTRYDTGAIFHRTFWFGNSWTNWSKAEPNP